MEDRLYGDGWGGARPDKRMKYRMYVYVRLWRERERERRSQVRLLSRFESFFFHSKKKKKKEKKDRFPREFHGNSSSRGGFNIDEERKSLDEKDLYEGGGIYSDCIYEVGYRKNFLSREIIMDKNALLR